MIVEIFARTRGNGGIFAKRTMLNEQRYPMQDAILRRKQVENFEIGCIEFIAIRKAIGITRACPFPCKVEDLCAIESLSIVVMDFPQAKLGSLNDFLRTMPQLYSSLLTGITLAIV